MWRFILAVVVVCAGASGLFAQEERVRERRPDKPAALENISKEVIEIEVTIAQWTDKADEEGSKATGARPLGDVNVKALEKSGELQVLQRVRLSTLSNLQAFVQIGERRPMVNGINSAGRGFQQTSINYQNIGTMVSATARVDGETIFVEAKVERSGVDPNEGPVIGEVDGKKLHAGSITTLTAQGTVALQSGDHVMLSGSSSQDAGASGGQVVLLTAKVLK